MVPRPKNRLYFRGTGLQSSCLHTDTKHNSWQQINTLRQRQICRHFADDIFKCIFLNENLWIPIKISLKFLPRGPINNVPSLVQIMAWRRPGDKPLSETILVKWSMHTCFTRPQWVKWKGSHNDYFVVTGYTAGCHYDNYLWWPGPTNLSLLNNFSVSLSTNS